MALLEVRDVSKTFESNGQAVAAIDRLSLDIDEREFVSIVGPSGCGKSTFLHIIGGFEKLTAGEIRLAGRPLSVPSPDRGMMFQDLSLFPWLTVIENVCWPLEMRGLGKSERLARAQSILELVHLGRFANLYPAQLSGGMRQRVALARLIALDSKILLMDEPFGALDAQTRGLMQSELLRIWQRTPKTVIFVTHDVQEAVYLADRVAVMSARPGRIKTIVETKFDKGDDNIFKEKAFVEKVDEIWHLVREEAIKAQGRRT